MPNLHKGPPIILNKSHSLFYCLDDWDSEAVYVETNGSSVYITWSALAGTEGLIASFHQSGFFPHCLSTLPHFVQFNYLFTEFTDQYCGEMHTVAIFEDPCTWVSDSAGED